MGGGGGGWDLPYCICTILGMYGTHTNIIWSFSNAKVETLSFNVFKRVRKVMLTNYVLSSYQ